MNNIGVIYILSDLQKIAFGMAIKVMIKSTNAVTL